MSSVDMTNRTKPHAIPAHRNDGIRICVDQRRFRVMPAAQGDAADAREQARFELYGRIFCVVEEDEDTASAWHDIAARLTERELQIAVLIGLGDPTKRVAHKLGITEWTVKEYLRRIFAKLGVRSQAAMIYRCADLLHRLERDGRLMPGEAGSAPARR